MKKYLVLIVLLAFSFISYGQGRSKKLSADEAAQKTSDQRLVYETQRKSKGKKSKKVSVKKKVKIEQKQDKKMRKHKEPKRRN